MSGCADAVPVLRQHDVVSSAIKKIEEEEKEEKEEEEEEEEETKADGQKLLFNFSFRQKHFLHLEVPYLGSLMLLMEICRKSLRAE